MVFCRTRHGADRLAQQLGKLGVSAAPIHGGRSQPQRDRALRSFSKGEVSALIATDVAARGVHVEGVGGVVHYDPPADSSTYVHRSGRTARAGASGTVVSLIDRAGTRDARKMGQQIGIDVRVTGADPRQLKRAVAAPAREQAPAQVRTTRPPLRAAAVGTPDVADVALFTPPTGRQVGTVTFFHGRRGYGFIDGGTGQDVFVHHTNVPTNGALTTGQRVEFAVRAGTQGPRSHRRRPRLSGSESAPGHGERRPRDQMARPAPRCSRRRRCRSSWPAAASAWSSLNTLSRSSDDLAEVADALLVALGRVDHVADVLRAARAATSPACWRRPLVVVEARVHLEVDVRPAPRVAGREDARERHPPVGVGLLHAAQVVLVGRRSEYIE